MNCKDCVHNSVCSLWRRTQGLDASFYTEKQEKPGDCDYAEYTIREDPKLRSATRQLRSLYIKAKQNVNIFDPIAYALYHTWRAFDEARLRKAQEDNADDKSP